jgi:hypothetical protein
LANGFGFWLCHIFYHRLTFLVPYSNDRVNIIIKI